jgi:aspartokinase/homoserine dehydrogenase 1
MDTSTFPSQSGKSPSLVMKFGGTSVGTAEAMAQAVLIVKENQRAWPRLVVVTSALSGVTDLLLNSAHRAAAGDLQPYTQAIDDLRRSHEKIADALISDVHTRNEVKAEIDHLVTNFANLCQAVAVLGEATPRALDAIASLGERLSVRLLAAAIQSAAIAARPVEATSLIVTDDHYQSAHPDFVSTTRCTRAVLEPLLAQGIVPVVTGFIGATPAGITTTLGRGGSDYSAAIIGAALPVDEVWIYTDVDGVMTADPRLVPGAQTIPVLSFKEIAELAYYGAKVLHPKTIRPVIDVGISVRVANTFNPTHPGTRLISEYKSPNHKIIKAVTAIRKLQLITIEGRGMLGVPGVAARTFGTVAAAGVSVPFITQASSEQSICFAVPMESSRNVVAALESAFAQEIACQDIDRVWATGEVAIVSVVGVGMRNTPGIAGRVFSALGAQNVNVIAIAQGSSEVSISILVNAEETRQAVQAIHSLIVE